ncbi:MAG: hypothetical protein CMD29_05880 [Flavobacteriales bacterium]|nr:hypothetical protein [Flavobacteriales bacterium]
MNKFYHEAINSKVIFQNSLIAWFKKNKRDLPWRDKSDKRNYPYRIMVSEFMLQQTTVKTVIPYFNKFIDKWNNIESLSKASEDELLMYWQGLGYYSRARNLLKTSIIISREFDGIVPRDRKELIKLPGIGDYTSAAILAIAYNKASVVIDGNIKRVISRYLGLRGTLETNKKIIEDAASLLSVRKNNENYSQALMELGALVCKPKSPLCNLCPATKLCISFKLKIQNSVPEIKKSIKKKKLFCSSILAVADNKKILLQKRVSRILKDQWELPSAEWEEKEAKEIFKLFPSTQLKLKRSKELYKHIFSHIELKTRVYHVNVKSSHMKINNTKLKWVSLNKLGNYPTTLICRNILKDYGLI